MILTKDAAKYKRILVRTQQAAMKSPFLRLEILQTASRLVGIERRVHSNSSLISASIHRNASAFCGMGRLSVVPGLFFITGSRQFLIKKEV